MNKNKTASVFNILAFVFSLLGMICIMVFDYISISETKAIKVGEYHSQTKCTMIKLFDIQLWPLILLPAIALVIVLLINLILTIKQSDKIKVLMFVSAGLFVFHLLMAIIAKAVIKSDSGLIDEIAFVNSNLYASTSYSFVFEPMAICGFVLLLAAAVMPFIAWIKSK